MGDPNETGCRWSSSCVKPCDWAIEQAGPAGRSPQCSLWDATTTVGLAGKSGDREHAPPVQGVGRCDGRGEAGPGINGCAPSSSTPKSPSDAALPELCTHGWLQPACACAGKKAFMAVSTSHAPADEPTQRQRTTHVMRSATSTIDKP
jgi:hypothetical protein